MGRSIFGNIIQLRWPTFDTPPQVKNSLHFTRRKLRTVAFGTAHRQAHRKRLYALPTLLCICDHQLKPDTTTATQAAPRQNGRRSAACKARKVSTSHALLDTFSSRQADNLVRRHHYDLTKTFDVLVGKEPNHQRFTVHHDLLVQRSEFFKAARSSRWTQPNQPTTLDDHDPETFSTYLHCLYFGVDAIKDRLNVIAEEYGATNEATVSYNESDSESSSDESSGSGDAAGNDVLDNGKEDNSSESNSDSDSGSGEGQPKQQIIEKTTPKLPNKLTILVNGEGKEAEGGQSELGHRGGDAQTGVC